jgi:hypothetical protein
MRAKRNIILLVCFIVPVSVALGDGASQDIKTAGGAAKTAVAKTGTATGKGTWKGLKATGRGLKWTGKKAALGTGAGIEKGGTALKSVGK